MSTVNTSQSLKPILKEVYFDQGNQSYAEKKRNGKYGKFRKLRKKILKDWKPKRED